MMLRNSSPTLVVVFVGLIICLGSAELINFGHVGAAENVLSITPQSSFRLGDSSEPFPCKLQNGCVCNHSKLTQNFYDKQYYATCMACQRGWTGPFCDVIDVPCLNGGFKSNTSDASIPCTCPDAWSGPTCEDRACPNSVGGAGANHIAPTDPSTQLCDHCLPGWNGVSCTNCVTDGVCASGRVCDDSLIVRGSSKHLECRVSTPAFHKLLGGDGIVTMDCNSEAPDVPFASHSTGTCSVAVSRLEANSSYLDPFFFCTAQNCSLRVDSQKDADSASNQPNRAFSVVKSMGGVVLLGLCAMLAIVGQISSTMFPRHIAKRFVLSISTVLVLALAVYIFLIVVIMNSSDTKQRNVVTYQCEASRCVCGPNPPPQYSPVCSTSAFGEHIIPIILHGMELKCHTDDNSCIFTPKDVQTKIGLDCVASECVDTNVFPEDTAIAGDAATTSKAQTHQSRYMVLVAACIALIIVSLLLLHIYVTFQRTSVNTAEFQRRFLATSRVHRSMSLQADSELGTVDGGAETDDEDENEDEGALHEPERRTLLPVNSDSCLDNNAAAMHSPDPRAHAYQPIATGDNDTSRPSPGRGTAQRSGDDHSAGILSRRELWKCMSASITLELRRLSYSIQQSKCNPYSFMRRYRKKIFDCDGSDSDDGAPMDDDNEKHILNDVTFTVQSGEVLALMGPSGAGKTTLLDLLAMRTKVGTCGGSLCINGVAVDTPGLQEQYRTMVGYVSQEDTLLPSLTVKETITYAARLKLPTSFDDDTIAHVVESVIRSLRLQRCADTVVGDGGDTIRGVSGGERRRVSIATELVANPRILFLDEPTSGLDALSAKHVMEAVVQLAKDSSMRQYAPHFFAFAPIVVFSIHQPSIEIYDFFDKVLLLSRGVAVYFGPAQEALPWLSSRVQLQSDASNSGDSASQMPRSRLDPVHSAAERESESTTNLATSSPLARSVGHENPAELLMKLEDNISKRLRDDLRAERAITGLRTHDGHVVGDPDVGRHVLHLAVLSRKYYPNVWQQLLILTSRSMTSLIASFRLIVCHSAVTVLVGSLMCILYHQEALDLPGALNRAGSMTFLLLVVAFVSLSSLDQLISERKLFAVERENGFYTTLPYLATKIFVDIIPLRVVPIAVLGAVIYFPMGLRTDDGMYFVWFLALLCLFSVCVTLITITVGIIFGSFGASALVTAVVLLWNFVFGGLLVQADTIPDVLTPFRFISPFFLTFEALLVNELNGQMCTFAPTDATGRPSSTAIPLFCAQYLANLGLHPSRFATDVTLLALLVLFLFALIWALLCRVKLRR